MVLLIFSPLVIPQMLLPLAGSQSRSPTGEHIGAMTQIYPFQKMANGMWRQLSSQQTFHRASSIPKLIVVPTMQKQNPASSNFCLGPLHKQIIKVSQKHLTTNNKCVTFIA